MRKILFTIFFFSLFLLKAQNIDSLFSFELNSTYLNMSEKAIVQNVQSFMDRSVVYHFWQVGVFVFIITVLIFLKHNFYKNLKDMFAAAFNLNLSKQFCREVETSTSPVLVLLNINGVLVWTALSYLLINYFDIGTSLKDLTLLLFIAISWIVVFFIKPKVFFFISDLFHFEKEYKLIAFSDLLLFKVSGIVLAPFIILIPFFTFPKVLVVFLFGGLLFLLVYMYAREFIIAKKYFLVSKYYFFIYLCASKIIPWIVSIKIIERIVFS